MSIVDQITEVLRAHEWDRCWWKCEGGTEWARVHPTHGHATHVAERIAEALRPELGELEATKLLLAATQEQHYRTIADFCAVRDALPREQVEQILAAVEETL